MYKFSKHIIMRMNERGISGGEILDIVFNKVSVVDVVSNSDQGVVLLMGYVKGKDICVVLNTKTQVLITVRRMRKDEKKYYHARFSDE